MRKRRMRRPLSAQNKQMNTHQLTADQIVALNWLQLNHCHATAQALLTISTKETN